VGFEPTTTYVSSANMHARQVFYQTKLPALLNNQVNMFYCYILLFILINILQEQI
jgi:hypothetical protein